MDSGIDLNLIERVWMLMHKHAVCNRLYATFREFREAILCFFHRLADDLADSLHSILTLNFRIASGKHAIEMNRVRPKPGRYGYSSSFRCVILSSNNKKITSGARIAMVLFYIFSLIDMAFTSNAHAYHTITGRYSVGKLQTQSTLERPDGTNIIYYFKPSELRTAQILLVILQGGDCNSVAHIKGINDLRLVLPEADLLTIEKIGIDSSLPYLMPPAQRSDCPNIFIERNSLEQRAEDVIRVIDNIRRESNYKYRRLVLLGVSEGAVLANILTTRISDVDITISINGGGRWFLDDLLHSSHFMDMSSTDLAQIIADWHMVAKYVAEDVPFTAEGSEYGYAYWRDALSLDRQAILMNISTPVLIVQGGKDRIVDPKGCIDMVSSLQSQGKDNISLLYHEELDHTFKDEDGQSKIAQIVAEIRKWGIATLNELDAKNYLRPPGDMLND